MHCVSVLYDLKILLMGGGGDTAAALEWMKGRRFGYSSEGEKTARQGSRGDST